MKFRNLTPHKLIIFDEEGQIIREFSSEGQVRIDEQTVRWPDIDGVPIVAKQYSKTNNLPEQIPGTILIVSKIVMDAHPERTDLLCPDTGPDSVVRNSDGSIAGVKRLQAP